MIYFYRQNEYWISVFSIIVSIVIWLWSTSIARKNEMMSRKERWLIIVMVASPLLSPVKDITVLFYITRVASLSSMFYYIVVIVKRMKHQ